MRSMDLGYYQHYTTKANLEVPTMKFTSTTLGPIDSKKGPARAASTPTCPLQYGALFTTLPSHITASSPVVRKKSLSKLDRPRILKRTIADCHVSTLPPPPKLRRAVARSFECIDDVDEPDYTMYDLAFPEGGRGYAFNTNDGDCKCAPTQTEWATGEWTRCDYCRYHSDSDSDCLQGPTKDGEQLAPTSTERELIARRHLLLHPAPRRRPWW